MSFVEMPRHLVFLSRPVSQTRKSFVSRMVNQSHVSGRRILIASNDGLSTLNLAGTTTSSLFRLRERDGIPTRVYAAVMCVEGTRDAHARVVYYHTNLGNNDPVARVHAA